MCPVLWDITDLHYDRNNCKMYDDTLMQQLLAVKGDSDKPLLGDCNGDGSVSAADLVLLQKYLLGVESLPKDAAALADCNGDGTVNGLDLAVLRQTLAQV